MSQSLSTTSAFILEKTAPVFNKQGYVGTSLSDLTKVTGLTKGAIYCNFDNKEDLALKAFEYNIRIAIYPLFKLIAKQDSNLQKLYTVTEYHRSYYDLVKERGGCPMLRVGVNAKFINPSLFAAAEDISNKFINGLVKIITDGISQCEFCEDTDVMSTAKIILSMIEGSSVLAFMHDDKTYISNAMDVIDTVIIEKMRS